MSSGTWKPGETKDRTGLYNWFVSLATSRINAAKKGVVGIPIKADWGPCNQLTICSDDTDIISTFGDGGTVYLARRAAKGGKTASPTSWLFTGWQPQRRNRQLQQWKAASN